MIDTFNDWIEFTGNEMPVRDQNVLVQIKFAATDGYASDPAPAFSWYWKEDAKAKITHYRIAEINQMPILDYGNVIDRALNRADKLLMAGPACKDLTIEKLSAYERVNATEVKFLMDEFCAEMDGKNPINNIVNEIEKILRNGGSSYAALCAIEEYRRLES